MNIDRMVYVTAFDTKKTLSNINCLCRPSPKHSILVMFNSSQHLISSKHCGNVKDPSIDPEQYCVLVISLFEELCGLYSNAKVDEPNI